MYNYRILTKYGRRNETENAKFCENTFVITRELAKVQVSLVNNNIY